MNQKLIFKWGVITLSIIIGFIVGANEWFIPYPYSKVTIGLSTGAFWAFIYIGLAFLLNRPKRPNLIYIILMSVFFLFIIGLFRHDLDGLHITHIVSKVSLLIGYLLGIVALYWLTMTAKNK